MGDRANIAARTLALPGPEATDALGAALAVALRPGDTLLLSGPIGAGKSHLARAILQTLMREGGGPVEEVPSPTYTLVQPYSVARGEVWHADLYRLGSAEEAVELGLDAAFGSAICLVEWPDRLGALAPADALRVALSAAGEGRCADLTGGPRWQPVLAGLEGGA